MVGQWSSCRMFEVDWYCMLLTVPPMCNFLVNIYTYLLSGVWSDSSPVAFEFSDISSEGQHPWWHSTGAPEGRVQGLGPVRSRSIIRVDVTIVTTCVIHVDERVSPFLDYLGLYTTYYSDSRTYKTEKLLVVSFSPQFLTSELRVCRPWFV